MFLFPLSPLFPLWFAEAFTQWNGFAGLARFTNEDKDNQICKAFYGFSLYFPANGSLLPAWVTELQTDLNAKQRHAVFISVFK